MPQTLDPLILGQSIVDDDGGVTLLFLLRWQQLISGFSRVGTVAAVQKTNRNAAIATEAAFTIIDAGLYRVSYYLRKTVADGVASSLTLTYGWTETGVALTESQAALVTDAITAEQSGSKLVRADAASDLTFAIAYASNTPGACHYNADVIVERIQ